MKLVYHQFQINDSLEETPYQVTNNLYVGVFTSLYQLHTNAPRDGHSLGAFTSKSIHPHFLFANAV